MRVLIGLLLVGMVGGAYMVLKDSFLQRRRNKQFLTKRNKTVYLWVDESVRLHACNEVPWATYWSSLLGTGSQEVILQAGEVTLLVSSQEAKGLKARLKKTEPTESYEVTVALRRGRQYELTFDSEEDDFLIHEVDELMWKTPLNQQFRQKHKRKKKRKKDERQTDAIEDREEIGK